MWRFLAQICMAAQPRGWTKVLCLTLTVFGLGSTARAEFSICNQSFDVVNVAIGQSNGAGFQTEGWWTIGTNQCAKVIQGELLNRYIYVYAADVFDQPVLTGSTQMCIGSKRFTILGIDECWQRGYRAADFFELDTQAVERWTLFLSPQDF